MNKDKLTGLFWGVLVCGLITWTCRFCVNKPVPVVERSLVIDTVLFYKPVPQDSVVVRYVTKVLPVVPNTGNGISTRTDTMTGVADSAEVIIPITQKIYEDSIYKAYVSGYDVALDSIAVYSKTVTIREKELTTKQPRLGFGIICGAGYGRQGLSPFIGMGVYYRIGK